MMTPAERNKKVIQNFLWLVLMLLAVAAITALTAFWYSKHPTPSADGWGAFNDGYSILVIGGFCLLLGLLWWTLYMVHDISKHRSSKSFVRMNIALLCVPYSYPAFLLGTKIYTESHWYFERRSITTTITEYKSIDLPESCYFRQMEIRNDSVFLYAILNKSEPVVKSDAFRFSTGTNSADGYLHNLKVYSWTNGQLSEIPDARLSVDSLSPHVKTVNIRPMPQTVFHHSPVNKNYIVVVDTADPSFTDSIPGYLEQQQGSIYSFSSYKEPDGNRWFYFSTEAHSANPECLYVACTDGKNKHVYKIRLRQAEKNNEWLQPQGILGLYKTGNVVTVVSIKKIITFSVENGR